MYIAVSVCELANNAPRPALDPNLGVWYSLGFQLVLSKMVVRNAPTIARIDPNVLRMQLYSPYCNAVFNGYLTLLHALYCNLRAREHKKQLPLNAWMQLCEMLRWIGSDDKKSATAKKSESAAASLRLALTTRMKGAKVRRCSPPQLRSGGHEFWAWV